MNLIKNLTFIVILISNVMLQADSNNENLWLMFTQNCDQYMIAQYQEVTVDSFSVIDEKGRNIYQIALDKHKETQSIPCARMAVFLRQEHERLRNKLNEESKVLDEAEKTFELSLPH